MARPQKALLDPGVQEVQVKVEIEEQPDGDREIEVSAADAGLRLDVFLAGWLGASRARIRRLLSRGVVSMDGYTLGGGDKGTPVSAGRRVAVSGFEQPQDERLLPEPESAGWIPTVLAQGPGWLALDKPAGRPVHPLAPDETGSVLNAVARRWPEVQGVGEGGLRSGVVHRLDVETSGALLVAIEQAAWQRLRAAFREHRVRKQYLALVAGPVDPSLIARHELALWVAQHRPARVRAAPAAEAAARPGARVGVLEIESIERFDGISQLRIRLETGFLHQVRATLAYLGHPILGDAAYGGDRAGVLRPMLHAAEIEFEEIGASAPLPADFVRAQGLDSSC